MLQKSGIVESNPLRPAAGQELELLLHEGCSFTVLDQPISLDRLQLKNIDQFNATGVDDTHRHTTTHSLHYGRVAVV